jgi:hypothetical protein
MTEKEETPGKDDDGDLGELLEETRILLPGSEILVAFLIGLPFTERFDRLTGIEKGVFLFTFFAALLALICFIAPAAYHRQARPIHDKHAFKLFANRFIVAGLVPMSVSLALATYLLSSLVISTVFAIITSAAIGAVILVVWWVIPQIRAHDRGKRKSSTS